MMNTAVKGHAARTLKSIYYDEDNGLVGWLEKIPDYRTQGETLAELDENLKELYEELTSGAIPSVRRVGEIVIK
jgi:predicted RNase H-like HicB family nuclease